MKNTISDVFTETESQLRGTGERLSLHNVYTYIWGGCYDAITLMRLRRDDNVITIAQHCSSSN